jgi:hypothetical protein
VERSATCPLCKSELWDGDEEDDDDDEEGESNGRHTAAAVAPLSPPRDYGANSWDRAWHRFFTNDAYPYLPEPQQQQQQPLQTTATTPSAAGQPPELSYSGSSLPMGTSDSEVITSSVPSLWLRMWSSSRRRLARRVHLMSSSPSSSDHGGASTSAMLSEPLLAHSTERENGSELRILSPRRLDPAPDDAPRIPQASREDGRRGDMLAAAETTTLTSSAPACTSSPAVPPASSSPPRQVSV